MNLSKLFQITGILLSAYLFTGCADMEKLGGGSQSIEAGTSPKECVYGIRSGQKLAFVIFTDLPSEGTSSSAGSSWSGVIGAKEGTVITYEGDPEGLTLNGDRFEFAAGRVFLVRSTEGNVSTEQLVIPFSDALFEDEIDNVASRDEVQAFLNP
ncbi:MAG: hypothetical protein AAGF67_11815 [Verrucomicrobiota bacterium]